MPTSSSNFIRLNTRSCYVPYKCSASESLYAVVLTFDTTNDKPGTVTNIMGVPCMISDGELLYVGLTTVPVVLESLNCWMEVLPVTVRLELQRTKQYGSRVLGLPATSTNVENN